MTATKTTREMYVKTRRAFRATADKRSPVMCIVIDFTSEMRVEGKIDHVSNYRVTLWTNGKPDTCTCMGFSSSDRKHPGHGTCCHITHFRLVEDMRRRLVVAEQPKQSIESVVALINFVEGKGVIKIGASTIPVPTKQLGQLTIKESRDREWDRHLGKPPVVRATRLTEVLSGNRHALPTPKEAPTPVKVSADFLFGRRSA